MALEPSGISYRTYANGAAFDLDPVSVFLWVNLSVTTGGARLYFRRGSGASSGHFYLMRTGTPRYFTFGINAGSQQEVSESSFEPSADIWYAIMGSFDSSLASNEQKIRTWDGTTQRLAQASLAGAPGTPGTQPLLFDQDASANARIAEVAVWNAEISADEFTALRKGVPPIRIRPDKLVLYDPVYGWSDNQLIAGKSETGTLVAYAHPPMRSSRRVRAVVAPTVVPVSLEQEGFGFYADDGSESAASALASQDADVSRAKAVNTRLRALVNATSDPPSARYKLQYRKSGDVPWKDV